MTGIPRFLIAAAHKSSGKTVVSTGIAAALYMRGLDVGVFKKGPDYIDPMWLALATGNPAYNLDFNTMSVEETRALFQGKSAGRDVNLIEANKGLFDGVAMDGSDSNAAMAGLLDSPVVLVVDTKGMTRGIAPLLRGYVDFDPSLRIAGVILNKTGGSRHEGKLRAAVETYTDLAVLGAVGAESDLDISERHLGLTTPQDTEESVRFVDRLGLRMEQSVDLDQILALSRSAPPLPQSTAAPAVSGTSSGLKIGVARDEAFAFYYPDDLEAFQAHGATITFVDMIRDPVLPEVDALFIGGGYPEVHARALSANASMLESVRSALDGGLPAYAECGGLMYLCRSLAWKGQGYPMVGFFDADTVMHARPQGRGYVRYVPTDAALWPETRFEQRAHEFHFANLENLDTPVFGREVTRGFGINGQQDALVKRNTQAGFIHLRHCVQTPWVQDFVNFAASVRAGSAVSAD
ncbi:MAG: cobyrinate a,c-diamide synthase [Marinibacterium sp.]